MRTKSTYLEVLGFTAAAIGFGIAVVMNIRAEQIFGALAMGALTLLCAWMVIDSLNNGVRGPTNFEWFKFWMNTRPIGVGVIGIGGLLAFARYAASVDTFNPLIGAGLIAAVIAWIAVLVYTITKAPRRYESDAQYRTRIKYRGR